MSEELKPILPYARHLNLKEIFIFTNINHINFVQENKLLPNKNS